MMKVALINIYQNKVSRGAETFVHELSGRLSKNHDVDVLASFNGLLKKRYSIIIPTNGRFQAMFTRVIAWMTGAKVIISGQSGLGLDDRINLYSFPDIFVGLTKYQSNWAKKINPFVNVETIPNGVDLQKFSFKRSLLVKRKTVLAVGAFTKEKGHINTIKALARIPDVKLIIAGSGGNQKQEIIDYGLEILGKDRLEVLSVDHDKMPDLYKMASLFVYPTVPWESFGIAMVEAMATNLPVVATDDPIRREIVGDAGLFVNPENTEEYATEIKKALETNWKNKPRKQAEKFSWDEIAKKYEELFNKLI